jgi:excisionase family DNA binding protein
MTTDGPARGGTSARNPAADILDEALTVSQVAEVCGVSATTIRRAARLGLITGWRTAGGHRRFSRAGCLELRRSLGRPGNA